ncbi:MAG: menaquinone biosynthesis protein [Planctomycetota bacterium]
MPTPTATATHRLGVVSFVNTLPLIDGLGVWDDFDLQFTVPSLLIDQLLARDVDAALVSSIDYQMSDEPLIVLPVGLLGCDGPTLTVRLYSSIPIENITRVYCDTDSHTSVVLLQILLREQYGLKPEIVPYHAREHVAEHRPLDWPESMLLIGDKVVTDSPPAVRYPHQLDLGEAWKRLTGMPFVFATWMARADADDTVLRTMARVLDHQRRHNVTRLDRIIHEHAVPRQWPRDLAARYLKDYLVFDWTDEREHAMTEFYRRAASHGFIPEARPVRRLDID